jgi:hypothetical protein
MTFVSFVILKLSAVDEYELAARSPRGAPLAARTVRSAVATELRVRACMAELCASIGADEAIELIEDDGDEREKNLSSRGVVEEEMGDQLLRLG